MDAITSVETLRDTIAPVKALVNEAVLRTGNEQVQLHALSNDKIATVTTTLPVDAFEEYTATSRDIGMNVERLDSFLSLLAPEDQIRLRTPPQTDTISVTGPNLAYDGNGINPQTIRQRSNHTPLPDAQAKLAVIITSDAVSLRHSIIAADLCSTTITILSRPEVSVLEFRATGDNDDMHCRVSRDALLAYRGERVNTSYSISKLKSLYEALVSRSTHLTIQLDTELVISLTARHTGTGATTRFTLGSHN